MNKSLATNLLAALIIFSGYFSSWYRDQILSIGCFALSGAVTNWLAVHMLFEKVPFLYGSGIIPNRFEEFKSGIRKLIMLQFFSEENLEKFFKNNINGSGNIKIEEISNSIDYEKIFHALVSAVLESPFGGMLSMFGGAQALDSIKTPFSQKIKTSIVDLLNNEEIQTKIINSLTNSKSDLRESIEEVVHNRLNELTPQMVKEIIQDMIRKHLGWLVVWGGVFGGLIGLGMSII
ncbi:MAG: DUF445 family protein [Deltaproteobacteria bacterium]|jgi:uncharacterized membrane protein YheB (UPF0754 family)|nr:DUF445 family protein [Deltaproteobacteria bacterium]